MRVDGSAQLREIAIRLRSAAGGRETKILLARDLRAAAQPMVAAVAASALANLPKKGGLNTRVAGQRVTVSVGMAARGAGVTLKTKTHDTYATNRGYVRHPYFGVWYENSPRQIIDPAAGWWTKPLERLSPAVTPLLLVTMERVAREIQGL